MTTSFAARYDAECAEDEVLEFWARILSLPIGERATIAATVAAAFRRSQIPSREIDCESRHQAARP